MSVSWVLCPSQALKFPLVRLPFANVAYNALFVMLADAGPAYFITVKFVHRPSGLSSDLNVNDLFGLQNSKMIKAYCDIVPAIARPLLFAIKKWASRRHINDPSGKSGVTSLNSYTICLL